MQINYSVWYFELYYKFSLYRITSVRPADNYREALIALLLLLQSGISLCCNPLSIESP